MNASQMASYKNKLLELRAELLALEEASKRAAQPVELDQSSVGRLSRMDALQAQQMALESARRRKRQLQRIDGALRRIATNDFGRCFVCEEEIGAARLGLDPTITRCVNCAED